MTLTIKPAVWERLDSLPSQPFDVPRPQRPLADSLRPLVASLFAYISRSSQEWRSRRRQTACSIRAPA
jgi:hypothetical protein